MSERLLLLLALAAPPLAVQLASGARPEALAGLACGLAGLMTIHVVARDVASRAAAIATTLLLLYGTFLAGVLADQPASRTPVSLLFSSAAVTLWWMNRERMTGWRAAGFGALAGLASGLRTAGAGLLLLPLSSLAAPGTAPWSALRTLLQILGGFVAGLALLVYSWRARPASAAATIVEALFSSRGGLFFWNPVLWAGLNGLVLLGRRDGRAALALFGAATVVVLAQPAAAAAGPGPLASAGFDSLLPLLAPGLAASIDALVRLAARRPARVLAATGVVLVTWNLLFMQQYRAGEIPRDATISFVAVTENSAALLSRTVGSPPAWPANWALAWRHRTTPDRFDLMLGKRLPPGPDGSELEVGELGLDAALLAEGWSVRHPCSEAVCREVEGRARLFAPLDTPGALELTVRATGAGALGVSVNGRDLGAQALSPALTELRFRVPAQCWRRLSEVTFTVSPGGQALVDRLRFQRPESAS